MRRGARLCARSARNAVRGSAFPFAVIGSSRLVLDGVPGEACGERADDDLTGVRSLLEPGGDVDRVARHEELAVVARRR